MRACLRTMLLMVVASPLLMGCGGLESSGPPGDASTEDVVVGSCPSAPDPQAPIVLSPLGAEFMGNVASSGCAFASSWIELHAGTPVVAAATLQPTQSGWSESALALIATVSSADPSINSPTVGSDGAGGFVVVWVSNGAMSLRNLSADGTPGKTVAMPISGNDVLPQWVEADGAGGYRVGFLDGSVVDGGSLISYLGYFAHVANDGSLLSGPMVVTPGASASSDADIIGFARASDHNSVGWVLRGAPTAQAFVTDFDDSGLVLKSAPLISNDSIQTSRHGLAIGASDAYFGVWETTGVLLGRGLTQAYTAVAVDGDGRPVVTFNDNGDLGVLANDATNTLHFSVVRAGVKRVAYVISPNQGLPYLYEAAGHGGSFASVWSSASGVLATVITP